MTDPRTVTDLETTALEGYPPIHGPDDDGECPCVHCGERGSRINAVRELARQLREVLDQCKTQAARLLAAEADRDRLQAELTSLREYVSGAESWNEMGRLRADRDRLQAKLTAESGYCGEVLIERDRYREALEQIAAGEWFVKDIARAALATPDTPPDA